MQFYKRRRGFGNEGGYRRRVQVLWFAVQGFWFGVYLKLPQPASFLFVGSQYKSLG